jgi:hypothetical protein
MGVVLLTVHPEPVAYCPCFEDSACFVGACVGILCGISITKEYQYRNYSILAGVIRYVIGRSFETSISLLVVNLIIF